MELTGHPFIDVGMAVAAKLAGHNSIREMSSHDLAAAVSHLDSHMSDLQKLKVLAIYWTNNPFMGKNMGKKEENFPNLRAYETKLRSLGTGNTPTIRSGVCQITGVSGVFSAVDRCWFPLGGSFLGDSVSYPNLSGKMISADCFRALISIPLGGKLCKGGVYAFHLLDPQLQVEAVSEAVSTIQTAIAAGENGNATLKAKTRLSGRLELLEIAALSRLWGTNKKGQLSRRAENGATIFAFSNSGTGAAYAELKLPAQALDFFAEISIAPNNLDTLFIDWAEGWNKLVKDTKSGAYDRICDDVEARVSLAPILGAMVRARKTPTFSGRDKELLKIYEDVALERSQRFGALERIAERINGMEARYRDSLVKQLANIRTKGALLELLRDAAQHREKTKFDVLTKDEIRLINESNPSEAINLLYLLCLAGQEA